MKKLIPGFVIVVLLAGCIPSVHPLITPEDAISMDEILGFYQDEEESFIAFSKDSIRITNGIFSNDTVQTTNTYIMSMGEKPEEMQPLYEVRFARFNHRLFVNFYPLRNNDGYGPPDYVPMNTFARVQLQGKNIVLEYSDMDELGKMFQEGKVRLKHEVYRSNENHHFSRTEEILITASTKQLQRFVKQHGGNDVFFGIKRILTPFEKAVMPGR